MFRAVLQGSVIRNEPAYRPRPDTMPGYHKFSGGAYDAFVRIGALEAIADKARRAAPDEMIGYLVGRPFRDAKGSYAVITEALFAESARCGRTSVETTVADERGLLSALQAQHPLAERLGWFHSHPFDMPNYSGTDLENQRFWSEPYQLGLLACFDTAGGIRVLAFRGPESEAIQPAYTTGTRPHDCAPTSQLAREKEGREAAAEPTRPAEPKPERRPGLGLLALAVGVIWPIAYLVGVGMIVQAVREARVGAPGTVAVAPVGATGSAGSKVATTTKSTAQPTQECQRTGVDDR